MDRFICQGFSKDLCENLVCDEEHEGMLILGNLKYQEDSFSKHVFI